MKGYVICMVVLAGCRSGPPPAPSPATTHTRVPAGAAKRHAAGPLTALEPERDGPSCPSFDPEKPACRAACRQLGLDDTCGTCPPPGDPAIYECQQIMACPTPPDPRVVACGPMHRRPSIPRTARINSVQIVRNRVRMTIIVGSNAGITKDTGVEICDTDLRPVPHGKVTVIRVDRQLIVGDAEIELEKLDDKQICLTPPP